MIARIESAFEHKWLDVALAVVCAVFFTLGVMSGLPRKEDGQTIRIVAPLLPPQIKENGTGREARIIEAAFAAGGIAKKIEFHVMPFTRHWQAFVSNERFAAVTTVPADVKVTGIRSTPYIDYQNGVFYRRADHPRGLGRDPLRQLATSRIVTFAGSTAILPQLQQLSATAPIYIERADQLSHSVMLENGFVDAVIADELIFEFYTRELLEAQFDNFATALAFAPVFCATPYQMVFRDFELRQAFNKGLKKIRRNGLLRRINLQYANGNQIAR
ncbi:MAG: transporter substrate-binding domain-containing protein, partial [Pseudomonadota bacterium]